MALLADSSADVGSNFSSDAVGSSRTFRMPTNLAIKVESVVATVNNTAGGANLAKLTIRDPSGEVISTVTQATTIDAGVSPGTASFALRLGGSTGGGASPGPGGLITGGRIFNTANQSVANATWTQCAFSTASWSYNASVTLGSPGYITVLQSGVYIVTFSAIFAANAAGARYAKIGVDAVAGGDLFSAQKPEGTDTSGATNYTVQSTDVLSLTAGQKIEGWVFQDSGGPLNILATGGAPPGGVTLSVAGFFLT